MRILAITNQYPPLSFGSYELQCLQISQELSRRGHQVRILTAKAAENPSNLQNTSRVFRVLETYGDADRTDGSFTRLYRKVRSNRRILDEHLLKFVPEVIMFWGMEGLTLSLAHAAERSAIPCVYAVLDHWLAKVCHDDPWLRYWGEDQVVDPPLVRNVLRRLRLDQAVHAQAPFGDVRDLKLENVFFCSESLKRETCGACNLPLEGAFVIPCGIAPADIRRRPADSARTGRLVYVARLSEEKDPLTAIRAVQELRQRGHDQYTIDIFGRGKPQYEAVLHDYVRRNQINGAVSFKPILEEQARNSLHLYDMLVFTSKYPEPFPLIHLRAMAARLPVISTAEGGCGELMRHGENGLTFETGNHFDLADKIDWMANHPDEVLPMVLTAFEEANHYYTFDRVTSHIETILHRAVGAGRVAVA